MLTASEKNTTNINYWAGPVLLGEKTFRGYLTRGPLTFMGPVSGSGGLYLSGDPAASDSGNINFHLMNPENTFTGPLGLYRVAAHLWNDGALPAGGAGAVVTNGAIVLENRDATYTLPQATFVGVGTQGYGRVAKGRGTWASVTKKGTGELDWQSASGSDLLDVQSGSVTITGSIRQELAGIIESYRTYYADNTTMNRFWDNVFTNGVTHSPDAYYNESHHLWTDSIPDSSKPRYMIAYTGYIWNNEPTNVTWSFAGMAGVHFEVRLDGERVFKFFGEGNASTTVSNTVAGVTPGSHLIDLRGYYMSAAKNTFPIGNPRCGLNWPSHDFAVGFDKLGRASPNQSDYAKLIDPGDGSLLTWARPEDIVPGETVSPEGRVVPNTVPVFKKMRFAAGTGVSFALRSYALAELEGLPAVTGAAEGLSITSRWTVAAADIAAGRKLTAEGPLAFGEGAVLEIDGEVRGLSATFTIAEATGGITGHPTLSPTTSTAWHLRRDGNSLKLDWTKGMMLIFR